MNLDLTEDEAATLAQLLRRAIDDDRYPLSPRLDPSVDPSQARSAEAATGAATTAES